MAPEVVEAVDLLAENALEQRKYREAIPLLKRLIAARDAETANKPRNPADALDALRLPMFDNEDEKDPRRPRCQAAPGCPTG